MITEKFKGFEEAENPTLGLALVFDISGFTKFFNKPDIQLYITDYINHVIDCVESTIWGGHAYWLDPAEELDALSSTPFMRKFLGDGILYVWDNTDRKIASNTFKIVLINRLYNLQLWFAKINKKMQDIIPVMDLPKSIKFGIAQGTIYKLTEANGTTDCIGPCINLASRLVKYCESINFVASARLNLPPSELETFRYSKIVAIDIKGFEDEIIIVDSDDFDNTSEEDRERLFKLIED